MIRAVQRHPCAASDAVNTIVGVEGLDAGESISGVVLSEEGTSDLTLTSAVVTVASDTADGVTFAAGHAFTFRATVAASPAQLGPHLVKAAITTDANTIANRILVYDVQ